MKTGRPEYDGIIDTSGKIPEDEPVFILRAQDSLAPTLVHIWASNAKIIGADPEIVEAALKHSEAMAEWQKLHGKKTPDMPRADAPARALADGSIYIAFDAPSDYGPQLADLGITWDGVTGSHEDRRLKLYGARHVPAAFLPSWATFEPRKEQP